MEAVIERGASILDAIAEKSRAQVAPTARPVRALTLSQFADVTFPP